MFTVVNLSLGDVIPGAQYNIVFPYTGIRKILKMVAPCDCSTPLHSENESKIVVRFVPKKIPQHLSSKGITIVAIEKSVTVIYIDQETGNEQTEILKFNAVVKQ